jgi:hypothetical protein
MNTGYCHHNIKYIAPAAASKHDTSASQVSDSTTSPCSTLQHQIPPSQLQPWPLALSCASARLQALTTQQQLASCQRHVNLAAYMSPSFYLRHISCMFFAWLPAHTAYTVFQWNLRSVFFSAAQWCVLLIASVSHAQRHCMANISSRFGSRVCV